MGIVQVMAIDSGLWLKARLRGVLLCVVVVVVMVMGVVGCERSAPEGGERVGAGVVVHTVVRGDVTRRVLAGAVIRPSDVIVIENKVGNAGKVTSAMLKMGIQNEYPRLIYLIEEGAKVKKGDLLFELESDQLRLVLNEREYHIDTAVLQVTKWTEGLAMAKMQAEADRLSTEANLEFAEGDLKKYVEGDSPLLGLVLANAVTKTRAKSELAAIELELSLKLHKNGYINDTDLESDRLYAQEMGMAYDLAESQLALFEKYADPRARLELERAIDLRRSEINARRMAAMSDIGVAEEWVRYSLYKQKLRDGRMVEILAAIEATKIYAPSDGTVIYASSNGAIRLEGRPPIAEGSTVYPQEEVVHLISSDRMHAEVKLMEMEVGSVEVGQAIVLTADALPGRRFAARVAGINLMATTANVFINPDLRQYKARIEIESDTEGLRPGMNAVAEIVIGEARGVVVAPTEAVRRERDEESGALVDVVDVVVGESIQSRQVVLGIRDAFKVEVLEGLEVGERVLLGR